MQIYIIRHGETDLEPQNVFSEGATDIPLNQNGIEGRASDRGSAEGDSL